MNDKNTSKEIWRKKLTSEEQSELFLGNSTMKKLQEFMHVVVVVSLCFIQKKSMILVLDGLVFLM